MMLSEMVNMFLQSRKLGLDGARKHCSPATLHIYRHNLGVFLDWLLTKSGAGIVSYDQLRKMHVTAFQAWLQERVESGQWQKPTRLQILRTLRTFSRWIDRDEDCQQHELKGFQRWLPDRIEKNPPRVDMPPSDALRKFKNSFKVGTQTGYRDYIITCLLMDTGLRNAEVCNLTITSMLLEDQVIIVDGKTGKRQVPITKEMVRLLKGWMKRREEFSNAKDSPYVFVSKYDPQMTVNGVGQLFRKHCKAAGLPRITAHTMRHMFCTTYLRKGGDMAKLRRVTGHTSYEMLENYLHLAKVGGKEARNELERVSLLNDLNNLSDNEQ